MRWTAGGSLPQHGRDRPAGLGERQRVVACLGGLQCPVGARPAERVVELDHEARRDLNGLLYADGIHDSLYRAVGRALTTRPPAGTFRPMAALHREG